MRAQLAGLIDVLFPEDILFQLVPPGIEMDLLLPTFFGTQATAASKARATSPILCRTPGNNPRPW
jgi:hypothetical protein